MALMKNFPFLKEAETRFCTVPSCGKKFKAYHKRTTFCWKHRYRFSLLRDPTAQPLGRNEYRYQRFVIVPREWEAVLPHPGLAWLVRTVDEWLRQAASGQEVPFAAVARNLFHLEEDGLSVSHELVAVLLKLQRRKVPLEQWPGQVGHRIHALARMQAKRKQRGLTATQQRKLGEHLLETLGPVLLAFTHYIDSEITRPEVYAPAAAKIPFTPNKPGPTPDANYLDAAPGDFLVKIEEASLEGYQKQLEDHLSSIGASDDPIRKKFEEIKKRRLTQLAATVNPKD